MSYILDALRKADAQRVRDPARGIHAQPLRGSMGDARRGAVYRPWVWFAAAAGVVSLATAGWYLYRASANGTGPQDQRNAVVAQVPPAVQVAQPPMVAPPPVVTSLPPPAPVAVVPPAAARVIQPPPVQSARPMPGQAMEAPRGVVSARAAAQGAPPLPQPANGVVMAQPDANVAQPGPSMNLAVVPVRPSVPSVQPAIVPAPPTAPVAGLPPDAPKLTITGGVYSTSRAQRMLIVNGQVFREGADLGSGVTLEEIRPKSVVLGFRGGRYSAPMP